MKVKFILLFKHVCGFFSVGVEQLVNFVPFYHIIYYIFFKYLYGFIEGLGLLCFTSLSTIFQLYRGGKFY
jgi:hypothetical protein